ncbi:hypothetical protein ACFL1T_02125 [Chlamydiota bacterium]
MNKNIFIFLLVLIIALSLSCGKDGDKDLANGTYDLSLVSVQGQYHSGTGYLTQIGTMLTMQLFTTIGNFNFAGELEQSTTTVTSHFQATGTDNTEIDIEFSASRSSFTGSITDTVFSTTTTTETSNHLVYLINGTKQ